MSSPTADRSRSTAPTSPPDADQPESSADGETWPTGREPSPADEDTSGPDEDGRPAAEKRVLVVTGLGRKNRRHYGPLADVAGAVTLVALEPRDDVDAARYVRVPAVGPRPVRLVWLLFAALLEGYRTDYDAVASISLFPYGWYALVLKAVYGYPAHLGIIGIDLDHHAEQWYGSVPRWAFRRFDAVSVPGRSHADELVRAGVDPDRIERLTNAIDVETYRPPAEAALGTVRDRTYDFAWVGRFSPEKDPLRFVEALAALDSTGREFRAVMVGDGRLRAAVVRAVAAAGLDDRVDLPGWTDEPVTYYRRSAVFVLTSRRDALPLALLEAMATGLAPVVPRVGSVPDVVADGESALVVPDRDPETFADAMARTIDDPSLRLTLAANATAVGAAHSFERAGRDWRRILATMDR